MNFIPVSSSIQPGLTLLEASAGTGKTYSLIRVIARHLVEHSIPLEQILTVTFTKAATAEIKHRLHQLLVEIWQDLDRPIDQMKNDLAKQWASSDSLPLSQIKSTLSISLASFDNAAIFTIDGFFQRLLKEFAFESGTLFNSEIETDEASLTDIALRDFWRTHVYPMDASQLASFQQHTTFDKAKKFLKEIGSSQAQLDPAYLTSPQQLSDSYNSLWPAFVKALEKHHQSIRQLIESPPKEISRGRAPFKKDTATALLLEIDEILEDPNCPRTDLSQLSKISSKKLFIEQAFKKGQFIDLTDQPYAELCFAISDLEDAYPSNLSSAYLGWIYNYTQQRLKKLKQDRNVFTYNDVTLQLANLLQHDNPAGKRIVATVQRNYQAALIDEFQDTSPAQCQVFLALFKHPQTYFHIIGDPKQSVYRFRGADVFAYIKASKEADHVYRLNTNYRSTPRMVHATNTLFEMSNDPFLTEGNISFTKSLWQDQQETQTVPPTGPPALHFHHLDPALNSEGNMLELVFSSIAREVRSLLDMPWQEVEPDSDRQDKVQPSDIAILVAKGADADTIARLLGELGIPVAAQTKTSLVNTAEAQDMILLLAALLEPSRLPLLRGALLSPTFRWQEVINSEQQFEQVSLKTAELHELWKRQGLMPMMLQLLRYFPIRSELLSQQQGLRKFTNVMHLSEMLDSKARSEDLSPNEILRWLELATRGETEDADSETLELRIATDRSAVTLLTQHRSKGLQFPITFVCPPAKRDMTYQAPSLVYHDANTQQTRLAAQEQTDDDILALRTKESCADRARLAYVSLTRSEHLCHFYYLPENPKKPQQNAIYQMLGEPTTEQLMALDSLSDGCVQYHSLNQQHQPALLPYQPDSLTEPEQLGTRCASATSISRRSRTSSFTGITHHQQEATYAFPSDEPESNLPLLADAGMWTNFKAGAALGSTLHEILEEIDFQQPDNLEQVILAKLQLYTPWKTTPEDHALKAMINSLKAHISTLLLHSIDHDLTLSQIDLSHRLTEPEFLLTAEHVSLPSLATILDHHPPNGMPQHYLDQLRQMPPQQFSGYLAGFIDLIFEHQGKFHLLDWKTNRIPGNDPKSLATIMAEHHYYLQYHLYTLALDRFLSQRLGSSYDPDLHLGNVYYVFLRGIDPDVPGSGVYCDQIRDSRLHALRSTYNTPSPC